MMALVTNRHGCLAVLVLLPIFSSLVTSKSLRMKREISHNTSTNTTETHGTTAVVGNTNSTTAETLQTTKVTTVIPGLNITATTGDHLTPDLNHTQQTHSAGNENLTVHPTTDNESTLHTQLPTTNATGHIVQAGSSAHTLPATLKPNKVTQKRMTTIKTMHTTKFITPEITTTKSTTTHSCPTASSPGDGLVSRCLIAIASMAALTTIFIITTVCLAAKLSGYRYRYKTQLQDTEMVCISALMNDSDHPVPKPRRFPKSNGALIPNTEDGDPEGDNLTLNSFLPDTDGPL